MAIDKTKWKTTKKIDFDKLGQDTFGKHKDKKPQKIGGTT